MEVTAERLLSEKTARAERVLGEARPRTLVLTNAEFTRLKEARDDLQSLLCDLDDYKNFVDGIDQAAGVIIELIEGSHSELLLEDSE